MSKFKGSNKQINYFCAKKKVSLFLEGMFTLTRINLQHYLELRVARHRVINPEQPRCYIIGNNDVY